MSKIDFAAQTLRLVKAVEDHNSTRGAVVCEAAHVAALPLLHWLDYLRKSAATGCCDEFLGGMKSAIVETCACLALGLVRPAIFSLRGQIDILLSWVYFRDHPVEWNHLQENGEGFMLKRDVLQYLEEYCHNFKLRFSTLVSAKTRREADPYRVLSAHVHSQSPLVLPSYKHLESLVAPEKKIRECIALQQDVAEYLGDILLAIFADKWASLPSAILAPAKARLGADKAAKVFV